MEEKKENSLCRNEQLIWSVDVIRQRKLN